MYDTIIIGAGMSGLAAGIRLAYYDQRVCILERHYTIGGLNSFYRLPRTRLRRRPARPYQCHAEGTKTGPLARLLRPAQDALGRLRDRAAARLRDRLPRRAAAVRQQFAHASRRSCLRIPREADNFDRLTKEIVAYDDLSESHARNLGPRSCELDHPRTASRRDAVLPVDVLRLCPRARHGLGPVLDHVPQHLFSEGLGRPAAGVRMILKHLVRKFRALGCELKLRGSVKRLAVENGRVTRVASSGKRRRIEARKVVSSAGWCETMRMCDDGQPVEASRAPGQLTFCENHCHARRAAQRHRPRPHDYVFNDHDKFAMAKAG